PQILLSTASREQNAGGRSGCRSWRSLEYFSCLPVCILTTSCDDNGDKKTGPPRLTCNHDEPAQAHCCLTDEQVQNATATRGRKAPQYARAQFPARVAAA